MYVEIVDKEGLHMHMHMHMRSGYDDANLFSECEGAA